MKIFIGLQDLEISEADPMASDRRLPGARNAAPTASLGDFASLIPKLSRARAGSSLAAEASKKHKAEHVALVAGQGSREKAKLPVEPPAKVPYAKSQVGKSRFGREPIRLTPEIARNVLFGHGVLPLGLHPEEYGDLRVYSGDSSSGEKKPST